jgi:hypothetical protein
VSLLYYLDTIKLYKKCFYDNRTLLNLTSMLSTFLNKRKQEVLV